MTTPVPSGSGSASRAKMLENVQTEERAVYAMATIYVDGKPWGKTPKFRSGKEDSWDSQKSRYAFSPEVATPAGRKASQNDAEVKLTGYIYEQMKKNPPKGTQVYIDVAGTTGPCLPCQGRLKHLTQDIQNLYPNGKVRANYNWRPYQEMAAVPARRGSQYGTGQSTRRTSTASPEGPEYLSARVRPGAPVIQTVVPGGVRVTDVPGPFSDSGSPQITSSSGSSGPGSGNNSSRSGSSKGNSPKGSGSEGPHSDGERKNENNNKPIAPSTTGGSSSTKPTASSSTSKTPRTQRK